MTVKWEYAAFFHKTRHAGDWLNPKKFMWELCSARMRKPLLKESFDLLGHTSSCETCFPKMSNSWFTSHSMCHCVAWPIYHRSFDFFAVDSYRHSSKQQPLTFAWSSYGAFFLLYIPWKKYLNYTFCVVIHHDYLRFHL